MTFAAFWMNHCAVPFTGGWAGLLAAAYISAEASHLAPQAAGVGSLE
jgi:hypothetical protein